jgi:hyperosmotically inducible periplasmic protein
MKKLTAVLLVIAIAMALGANRRCFAQSASSSMEHAGSDLEGAAQNAYQGTKTAVKDSDVTAKVKLALHDDSLTKGSPIHVSTVAGVVTLRGTVASSDISDRAEKLARDTTGVKDVHNKLHIPKSTS